MQTGRNYSPDALNFPVAERTVMAIAMKGFKSSNLCGEDEQAFHFAVP